MRLKQPSLDCFFIHPQQHNTFKLDFSIIFITKHYMIVDLRTQFLSQFKNLPEDQFQLPLKIPIQSKLCYKQSQDILISLSKISGFLADNKQNYFSNAAYSYNSFTDQQRNQFDKEMRTMLDQVNFQIGQLKKVVDNIKNICSQTEIQHLKQMTICLYQRYKKVFKVYREFVDFNENRKMKIKQMIGDDMKRQYKLSLKPTQMTSIRQSSLKRKQSQIDPQLEQQSKLMYQEKLSQHKSIQQSRKTIQQINGILDVMENKILEQQLLTSSFRQIGEIGLIHIQKGNKNLVDANTLSKNNGVLWTTFFLTLAFSLLIIDFIKS